MLIFPMGPPEKEIEELKKAYADDKSSDKAVFLKFYIGFVQKQAEEFIQRYNSYQASNFQYFLTCAIQNLILNLHKEYILKKYSNDLNSLSANTQTAAQQYLDIFEINKQINKIVEKNPNNINLAKCFNGTINVFTVYFTLYKKDKLSQNQFNIGLKGTFSQFILDQAKKYKAITNPELSFFNYIESVLSFLKNDKHYGQYIQPLLQELKRLLSYIKPNQACPLFDFLVDEKVDNNKKLNQLVEHFTPASTPVIKLNEHYKKLQKEIITYRSVQTDIENLNQEVDKITSKPDNGIDSRYVKTLSEFCKKENEQISSYVKSLKTQSEGLKKFRKISKLEESLGYEDKQVKETKTNLVEGCGVLKENTEVYRRNVEKAEDTPLNRFLNYVSSKAGSILKKLKERKKPIWKPVKSVLGFFAQPRRGEKYSHFDNAHFNEFLAGSVIINDALNDISKFMKNEDNKTIKSLATLHVKISEIIENLKKQNHGSLPKGATIHYLLTAGYLEGEDKNTLEQVLNLFSLMNELLNGCSNKTGSDKLRPFLISSMRNKFTLNTVAEFNMEILDKIYGLLQLTEESESRIGFLTSEFQSAIQQNRVFFEFQNNMKGTFKLDFILLYLKRSSGSVSFKNPADFLNSLNYPKKDLPDEQKDDLKKLCNVVQAIYGFKQEAVEKKQTLKDCIQTVYDNSIFATFNISMIDQILELVSECDQKYTDALKEFKSAIEEIQQKNQPPQSMILN